MKKYVKLMADYCSSGVWEANGYSMDINDLPVSDSLKSDIKTWVRHFERNEEYLSVGGYGDKFNVELFGEQGFAIAKAIKQELPDWTVMYYDERVINKHINGETLSPATNAVYEVFHEPQHRTI